MQIKNTELNEKLQIGIICHGILGGSSSVAVNLAEYLAQRGHQIHLFTGGHAFDKLLKSGKVRSHLFSLPSKGEKSTGVLHTSWHEDELCGFLNYLENTIRNLSLDILHIHYALPFAFLASELKKRLGRKCPILVLTLHGSDVYYASENQALLVKLRKALLEFDALTTVSHFLSQFAAVHFNLNIPPLVIPNFVDTRIYHPKFYGRFKKEPVIAHISNFRPIKNSIAIAEIFIELRKKIDIKLKLVGDGIELPKIKRILKIHRLEEHVSFLGMRSDISDILAEVDILLMTSHLESFCLVALEAMACGIPVVAPKVGGIPEVVRHTEDGYLYDSGNHKQAVEAVLNLMSDNFIYQSISKHCVKQAQNFSVDLIIQRYECLYHCLLLSKPAIFCKHSQVNFCRLGSPSL